MRDYTKVFTFYTYHNGHDLALTTHHGIPVVRYAKGDCPDLGPGDPVPKCLENEHSISWFGRSPHMAAYVSRLIDFSSLRKKEIREGLRKWFAQMPGGPQIIDHETGGQNGGPHWHIR